MTNARLEGHVVDRVTEQRKNPIIQEQAMISQFHPRHTALMDSVVGFESHDDRFGGAQDFPQRLEMVTFARAATGRGAGHARCGQYEHG